LLPRRLSQLGPGVAWTDFDEDGWDDLLVAGGKGGRLAGFRNQGDGTFTLATNAPLSRVNSRDQTTVIGFGPVLLVGSSNYEDGLTNGGALRVYDLRANAAGESVMGQALTAGPLASADVDGDGTLDLFIGGRVVPGRYPEPASSLLLRKEGSRLVPTQRFEKLGLVSGAVFSDLNGDGAPDLILACEWGPVRIFRNERGALKEWNPPLRGTASNSAPAASFQELTGWWAGVATGDLDGDGRPDIIASNWGLNSRYRPSPTRPIRLHYGDLDDNGALDVIESGINPANGQEVPTRGWKVVQAALPFLQGHIESFEAYGKASLAEIYGDALKSAGKVEAIELSSMAFLNRGDYFEVVRLPAEAQWAPAFGVCVADFDGDGAEDVFLSQNFFAVNPDDWRQDAGRGLLLRGDGKGGLTALSAETSGVKVYGEQRGCAAADYDGDGRTDLAVGQNAAATVLLRNVRARPGLRVRLDGPAGNPRAVGASVRLKFGDRLGPAREVQAGSGYWSQDSSVLVLSAPERPSHVWVRWPGGKVTTSELPEGAKEVRVNGDGGLTKSR
jgi:hypothetical protein